MDRVYTDLELPVLPNGTPPAPDAGFISIYGKEDKLAYKNASGIEVILDNSGGGGGTQRTFAFFIS